MCINVQYLSTLAPRKTFYIIKTVFYMLSFIMIQYNDEYICFYNLIIAYK